MEFYEECHQDAVCLTIETTVAIATWAAEMQRIQAIVEACHVTETAPDSSHSDHE